MLPSGAIPIRPITGRRSLAPPSCTRRPLGWPCGSLAQQDGLLGRRRAYHVPPVLPCGLGRASPPVVRRLRRRSSEPPGLTPYLLVQAYQHLALGITYGVYQQFTWVDRTAQSWFPTPLDARSRGPGLATVTALRSGGGYVVPEASHVTVTPDARPSRILLAAQQVMSLQESMTVTSATSCRTRTCY